MHTTEDDVEHFVDLLVALPWQTQDDGRGVELGDAATNLHRAIVDANSDRRAMLLNGQLDFLPLLQGKRSDSLVTRAAMYAFVVFDGAPREIVIEAGQAVLAALGMNESDPQQVGQRWIADLTATTYRLLLRDTARIRRDQFESGVSRG